MPIQVDPTVTMVDQFLRLATLFAFEAGVTWVVYAGLTALIVLPWWLLSRRKI